MKTKLILTTAFAVTCITSLPGLAADDKKGAEYRSPASSSRLDKTTLGRTDKASDLIGMEIKNYQNEKLGKLEDLAVDVEAGRIVHVILSTGGFLGIADKHVAVPPGALHCDTANKVIHLDANKEKLKGAPKFEMSKWAECCEANHVTELYRYYGQEPYFVAKSATDRDRLGHVMKATKVIGLPVRNLQDEKLGKVENLMVDLPAGRLVTAVLSTGGFLGLGDELNAVPPGALRYNSAHDGLVLDATKESLTKAPHFKSNEWPDTGEPTYAEGVYRAYNVEPYFSKDADNTARNVRDRKDQTLTPLDQGKSTADIDSTARIRKAVRAEKGLSVNAQNVKIITVNGRVTLRGVVNTEQEKRRIGEIAASIATSGVDNQLEVKSSTTSSN